MPNHPYVSAQGALVKTFEQFRKSVPQVVDADFLRKFEIAPKNESYVINTLRFLGIVDDKGKRIESNTEFLFDGDAKFQDGLKSLVRQAYDPLFSEVGEGAWTEPKSKLTSWFRVTDKTSEVVGGRQAQTFITLAGLAGETDVDAKPRREDAAKKKPPKKKQTERTGGRPVPPGQTRQPVRLTTALRNARVVYLGRKRPPHVYRLAPMTSTNL